MYFSGYCHVSPKAQAKLKEFGVNVEATAEKFDIPNEYFDLFRYYAGDPSSMAELYTEEEIREERLDDGFKKIERKACDFFGLDASTRRLVRTEKTMGDGGTCTGHLYDCEYSVLGTAGNLAEKKTLAFSVNDGHVMRGSRRGPLNENPVWKCSGIPNDMSIGIISSLRKFGFDRCSSVVFVPSNDCAVRDKYELEIYSGWSKLPCDSLMVFDKKDSDGKRFALGRAINSLDYALLSLDEDDLRELYRDDVASRRWNKDEMEHKTWSFVMTTQLGSSCVDVDKSFVRDLVESKAKYYRDQSTKDRVDFVRARYAEKAGFWEKILRGDVTDDRERSRCGFGHEQTAADKYMKYRHMQESPSVTAEEKAGYGQKMDYWADIARKDMEYDKVHHGLVVPERTDVVVDRPDAVFVGVHEVKKLGPDEEYDDASYSW